MLGSDPTQKIALRGTVQGMNPVRFTGGSPDTTTLAVEDPTADNLIIFPDESGAVLTTSSSAAFGELVLHGELSLQGGVALGDEAADRLDFIGSVEGSAPLHFEGPNADTNDMTLLVAEPTSTRTLTVPDESGEILVSSSATSSLSAVGALSVGSLGRGFGSIYVANAVAASASIASGATIGGNTYAGNDADDSIRMAAVVVNENAITFEGGHVDDFQLQLRAPSPSTHNYIVMPDASGTSVMQATDRFLSIDHTGDLAFTETQITEVGEVRAGALGLGFGPIQVESLRTDAMSALGNAATFGGDGAFALRCHATSAANPGALFELHGQDGHESGNFVGGDISVQPGQTGSSVDGRVRLSGTFVTSRTEVSLSSQALLPVRLDAGSSSIVSDQILHAKSLEISRRPIGVNNAVTAAVATSHSDIILVGGDASFVLGRPVASSAVQSGAVLRLLGQTAAARGGSLMLHPGNGGAGSGFVAGALVLRASSGSGASDTVRVSDSGIMLSQPARTSGIDAETALVRTSGSLHPHTLNVAGSTSTVDMILSTSLTSPLLIHFDNEVAVGGDSSFVLSRPWQAGNSPGQQFELSGQHGFADSAGGDLTLRPGSGGTVRLAMSTDGVAVSAAGVAVTLPLRVVNVHAGSFPIDAYAGVASTALFAGTSMACSTMAATNIEGTRVPSVTTPRLYGETDAVDLGGDVPFRIQRTPAAVVSATLIIAGQHGQSGGSGGGVVLSAGAGDSDSNGSIQMGAVNVETGVVELSAMMHSNNIAIRGSQPLQTDAAHGVSGHGMEASISATVQTAVAQSLQTPAVVSSSDTSSIGDDDPFFVSRPAHRSGSGHKLVVQGQSAVARTRGGKAALRPGYASQTKVFHLVQPAALGLQTDVTFPDAVSYCRDNYQDIASITTDDENVLAANACLLDTATPMQRCMFGGSNGDVDANPTRAWSWSDGSAFFFENWQGDEGDVASNSGRTAYIGFGSAGAPHQWQDWATFSHAGQLWGFLCQVRLQGGSTVLHNAAGTPAITVSETDLEIGETVRISGTTVTTTGVGAFGSLGAVDAVLSGAVVLGQPEELVNVHATVVPFSLDGSLELLRFDGTGIGTLTWALPSSGVTGNRLVEFPDESGQVLTSGDFASVETLNANGDLFEMGDVSSHFVEFNGHVSPVTAVGTPGPLLFDRDSDGQGLQWEFPAVANLDATITFPYGSSCTTAVGVAVAISTQTACVEAGHVWQAGTVLTDSSLFTDRLTQLGTLIDLHVSAGTQLDGTMTAGDILSASTEATKVAGTATLYRDVTLTSAGRTAAFTVGQKQALGATGSLTLKGPNSLKEGVFNGGDVYLIGGRGGSVHANDARGGRVTIDGGGYVGSTADLQGQPYQLPNESGGPATSCGEVSYEYRSICSELGGPSGTYLGDKIVYGGVYIGSDSGKVRIGKSQSQCGSSQTCESTMRGDTTFTGALTVQKLSATVDAANVLLLGDDDQFILCATCNSQALSLRQKGASFVLQGQAGHGDVGAGGNVVVRPGLRGEDGTSDGNLVIRAAEITPGDPHSGDTLVTISNDLVEVAPELAIGACNALNFLAGDDSVDISGKMTAGCPGTADGIDKPGCHTLLTASACSSSAVCVYHSGNIQFAMSNLRTEEDCLSNNVNNVWTGCCRWSPIEPGIDLSDQDLDAGMVDASTLVTTSANVDGSLVVQDLSDTVQLEFGSQGAWTMRRTARSSGAGTSFVFQGQSGGLIGGDLSVRPGAGTGGLHGTVQLQSSSGALAVKVGTDVAMAQPLVTGPVDLGVNSLTANVFSVASVSAADAVVASRFMASSHIQLAAIGHNTDELQLGGDSGFHFGRLSAPGSGRATAVVGQNGAAAPGGKLLLRPGGGSGTSELILQGSYGSSVGVQGDMVTVATPLSTGHIVALGGATVRSARVGAGTISTTNLRSDGMLSAPSGVSTMRLLAESNVLAVGVRSSHFVMRKSSTRASTTTTQFLMQGQAGSAGAQAGGSLVLRPGAGGSVRVAGGMGGNWAAGTCTLDDGSVVTALNQADCASSVVAAMGIVRVIAPLQTVAMDAQSNAIDAADLMACDDVVAAVNSDSVVQAGTLLTLGVVRTPLLSSDGDSVHLGSQAAFRLMRTGHSGGNAAKLTFVGQPGASGSAGGDLILRPGSGNTGGALRLSSAADDTATVVTVADSAVTLSQRLQSGRIRSSSFVRTTGSVQSQSARSTAGLIVSTSMTVDVVLSTSQQVGGLDTVLLGGDPAFAIHRSSRAAGAGLPMVISGQAAHSQASGGSLVLRPGSGSTGGNLVFMSPGDTPIVTLVDNAITVHRSLLTPSISAGTSPVDAGEVVAMDIVATAEIQSANCIASDALLASNVLAASQTLSVGGSRPLIVSMPARSGTSTVVDGSCADCTTLHFHGQAAAGTLPNNQGGGIVVRAGQHGGGGGSDGSVTFMDGRGNAVIKGVTGTADSGGVLTSQSWQLGTASYGSFKLARDAPVAISSQHEAGTTYFKGQMPGTDAPGGDLRIRGGGTGGAAAAGGDIFIDAGRSKVQGGAAALYGALLVGTISGTVNIGQPTFTTTISGTAQVLENLVVSSLDSESESLGFCDSSSCYLMKGEYSGHTTGAGTSITFRGQQGAMGDFAGGDLILRAGEDRNSQTPGLVTISTARTGDAVSAEVLEVGPLYACPDYGSDPCRRFTTWTNAADAVYVKSAQHTLYTVSLDAGSAGIHTTVARAHGYTATAAVHAATMIVDDGPATLVTPKLRSSGDEIQVRGSSDSAATTITRGSRSQRSDFAISGQASSTGLGGNMVLQAGDSTTTQGRVVFASGDSSACDRNADGEYSSCSLAYVDSIGGIFHQQVLTPAGIEVNGEVQGGRITTTVATASSQVSAVSIVATGFLSANTVTDAAVQFGDDSAFTLNRAHAAGGSGTSVSLRGQSAAAGVGGDVVALPGLGAVGAPGVVSLAMALSGQSTVTVRRTSVHFSQAIQSTKAVDAADGTVGTTGRFVVTGGNVAIAADSTSQNIHAASYVQLQELLGETASAPVSAPAVSLGSAGIGLTMRRAQHSSWDGTETALRGQTGGTSQNGGSVVLRAGGGSMASLAGRIVLKDSEGAVGVTMRASTREISVEKALVTQSIDSAAGTVTADTVLAYTLSSTAGDSAESMSAQTLDVSTAATVGALRSASDILEVGGGNSFVVSRPDVPPYCQNSGTSGAAEGGYTTKGECERIGYVWDDTTGCIDADGRSRSEYTTQATCLGTGNEQNVWRPDSTARLKMMGQAGLAGGRGGNIVVQPGEGGNSALWGDVRVADANGNTVILVTSDYIRTAAVMNTESIDAGANTVQATQLTGGTVEATSGVAAQKVVADQAATPQLISGTAPLGLGDTAAFVAKRSPHSTGSGTIFSIRGQSGAASTVAVGGSVQLKAGAGVGHGAAGALELESASGAPVVRVDADGTLAVSQMLRTRAWEATQIATSGTASAAKVSAPGFDVSSSLNAPALKASDASSQSQTVLLGSTNGFDVKRPAAPGYRCHTSSGTIVTTATTKNACERTGFEWATSIGTGTCSIPILAATVTSSTGAAVPVDPGGGTACCQPWKAVDGIAESQSGFLEADATYWRSTFAITSVADLNFDMKLQTSQRVHGVVVHWQSGPTQVTVWSSRDGVTYVSRIQSGVPDGCPADTCAYGTKMTSITFSEPVSAKYIRISMTGVTEAVGIYAVHVVSGGSTLATCETTGNAWMLPDGSEFYIAGQRGFSGSRGGDVVFVTGSGAANGDLLVQGAGGSAAVLTVVGSGVTVHQPLHPLAGLNADKSSIVTTTAASAGLVSASVQLTAVEVPATISVAMPLLLPSDGTENTVQIGGPGAVALRRTAHRSSHGTEFVIAGQLGGVGNSNGGSVILRGGSSSSTGGHVQLQGVDSTSAEVLSVAPASVVVLLPLSFDAALDAGGETIAVGAALTATGSSTEVDVAATTATSDRLQATAAIVAPVFNPSATTIQVGGDGAAKIARPVHTTGPAVDFRIQGQSANAGDDIGVDAGHVVLRPGAKSGGSEAVTGVISVQSAGGSSAMLDAVSSGLRVPVGSSLRTVDTLKVPGSRVAKPPATTAVSDDSTVIALTTELVLLDCDDHDSARNEVFAPTFAAGVDGQVVRMVNVGEDVCVFKGPEPLTNVANNNFRLLAGNQAQNQAFLPTSGTPVSFMYYHTPSDIACSEFNRADNPHTHQTTCEGGGWYQVVEAPATYCTDTCAADGLRWCQHEATHAAPSVSGVAAAFINGDARVDIVSVSSAGAVSWFESAADGGVQWTQHEIAADASGARHVLVLDIDGDGDQDVATLVDSSTPDRVDLVWFENEGGPAYSFAGPYIIKSDIGQGTGYSLAMVAGSVGTVPGDDIVVVSSQDTAIMIFECAAGATCTEPTHWGDSGTPVELSSGTQHIPSNNLLDDIMLADLDADADLDIVTVSRSDSSVRWYQNLGSNQWSKHGDTNTGRANYFITQAPQSLSGTRLQLAAFDMNGDMPSAENIGLDVVVSSPGNGRLYVLQNLGQNGWSQITMNSDSPGVTAVVVADVDNDGREDVIAAGETSMKYHLTGGGGIHGDVNHPGHDGQTWTALTATEFTGTCEYNTQTACADNGGTWDTATETCEAVPATLACYANSGVNKPSFTGSGGSSVHGGGARGWAAPTLIAAADVAGDGGLDIVFASDSASVHDGTGYVGVYESIRGTC